MLYDPAGFEPLTDEPWDDERARASIRRLVARIDETFAAETLWPAHEWDGWQAALPLKNLYVGAAGVQYLAAWLGTQAVGQISLILGLVLMLAVLVLSQGLLPSLGMLIAYVRDQLFGRRKT